MVAKEYPSVPKHSVGEQSLNELHQLVVEQQQNMNALRQQMDRQNEEMMERFQQLLVRSFELQENALTKKAEKQRILLSHRLHNIIPNWELYRANNGESIEGETGEGSVET